jgi:hypothetical protein
MPWAMLCVCNWIHWFSSVVVGLADSLQKLGKMIYVKLSHWLALSNYGCVCVEVHDHLVMCPATNPIKLTFWWNFPLFLASDVGLRPDLGSEVHYLFLCPLQWILNLCLAKLVWLRCMSIRICARHKLALCGLSCCYSTLPMKQKLRLFPWL